MAKLTFNREPYFDDFDQEKNFYQILFRPSRAIQTRELNQLQTILGHQIEGIGDHLWKFGSMVRTGSVRFMNQVRYVRLKDLTPSAAAIDVSLFDGRQVRGKTSGLLANVLKTSPKDDFDPATIFVEYTNTAIDGVTRAFVNGETLEVLDSQGYPIYEAVVRCPDCTVNPDSDLISPTGFGSLFGAADASYYVHGRIIPVTQQTIVLDKYGTTPSYKIGFDIVQTIVTADQDISLLDNALGSPNFTAPGADRYRINLVLSKKPLDDDDDENFVLLARVDQGYLQEVADKPQYGEIMNMLARRTYDESGDYTVRPFTLNFREHLKEGSNDGWKTAAEGGDSSKFITVVSPGKAYVRGREIEVISDRVVEIDKARDTDKKRSSVVRAYMGNYIIITMDPVTNLTPVTSVQNGTDFAVDFGKVNLYDNTTSGGNYSGNQVGTARVKGIELHSGTAGDPAAEWKLYIFEMVFATGKNLQDVVGLHRTGGGSQTFGANIVQDGGVNKIYEPINNKLLFTIPYQFNKSIRDADNPLVSNTSVTVVKKLVGAVNAQNKVIFSAEGDETFLNFDSLKWIGGLQQTAGGNFLPYDLTVTDRMVVTPSQITVQNFAGGDVGKNFVLICEVLKSNAKEKTKVLDTVFLSAIPADVASISLQYPDIFRVVSVYDTTNSVDVTDNYVLDNGVRDNYYGIGKLTLKSGVATPDPGTLVDIEFEYFQHTGTGYYFSVDSYTTIVNDPGLDFDYEDIPVYTALDGTKFRMTDTIDFRPTIGTDGTFSHASAVLSNTPVDESNIIFDVEYYLPRIDLLCLTDQGDFIAVKGDPDLNPSVPHAAESSMAIYQIPINAYTFDVQSDVAMRYLDNKRYTMRDIGRLEKRIENLEYYVTFNLLEKATADTDVLDGLGNTRFKNGFLVDNFKDFIASDTTSPEYSVALDTDDGILRPSFLQKSIRMELDTGSSSNYHLNGKVITMPYTDEEWLKQPFATKSISVNPYLIWNVKGIMALSPSTDMWKDVNQQPAVVTNIDTGFEAIRQIANAAGVLGTTWGNWRTTNTSRNTQVNTTANWLGTTTTTTTTTTSDQTRTGVNRSLEREVTRRSLGTFVTSVNLIPYIRSIPVQFAATGLRPRTKVYAFFDGVDVNEDTRPMNGSNGQPLVTDANGNIVGVFTIPNRPDKRFFTGTREFILTTSPTNADDVDEVFTFARAQYHAGGLRETRRESVISVTTPRLTSNEVEQNRTLTTQSVRTNRILNDFGGGGDGGDPLAQSFVVEDETGVFLTGIDLYFAAKDEKVPVWFQIRNMINGYPGTTIVPFSDMTLKPNKINVSEDGSIATRLTFEAPVYLNPDEEYCFVVGSDVNTHRLFACKLGSQTLGANPVTVSKQPTLGSMFKSQNNRTWTAEQFEDIKFTLYRAEFNTGSNMNLTFNNIDYGLKTELPTNPFETENLSRDVRVYMKNHGLVANDKVKLELLQDTWYELYLQSGNLVVGQKLTGGTNGGTAIIKELEHPGLDGLGNNVYRVKLSELKGIFADGEQFSGALIYESYDNSRVLEALDIVPVVPVHNVAIGTFPTGVDNTFNGIPLDDLSTPEHLVQHVDSMDSFIIQVDTQATASGRVGGSGTWAVGNVQMDAFDFQVSYIDFKGDSQWSLTGVTHGGVGSNVTNYSSANPVAFVPNVERELRTPLKIANTINQDMNLGGNPSIVINATLTSDDSRLSPVINIEEMGLTSITNRVEWNDCANFSVSPNATESGDPVICDPTNPGYTGDHRWSEETAYDGGSEGAKYIMKPVNLESPATNIKVYMDLLNTLDTEVKIFYRTLPSESDAEIQSFNWIEADFDNEVVSEGEEDYRETEATIPAGPLDTLPEFKAFQIKLVLRSKNSARPPKARNFRAIAVT
jgi:hypothetical protein